MKDVTKTIASIVVIVLLAVLIANMNTMILQKAPKTAEEGQDMLSRGNVSDYGECFNKDPSTIVFLYSNSCPYCKSIMPIIEELEKEGYKFYWAESSDSEAGEIVSNCFNDLLSGYVPQFICPATGEEKTGAMSKAELKGFADDCI